MTKEELIKQIGELESNIRLLAERDTNKREEISVILGSYTESKNYGTRERDIDTLGWMEIANRIGKLQARESSLDRAERIDMLGKTVEIFINEKKDTDELPKHICN